MIYSNKTPIFSALILALFLGSCITKKYESPKIETEQLYRDATPNDTTSLISRSISELFSDTVLVNLIQEGIRGNFDLKIAVQRINEAQANLRLSQAAFLPGVGGSVQAVRAKSSAASLNFPSDFVNVINLKTTTYQAALNTSWEADIWGKLSSAKRSALAGYLQSDAAKRAVQTQLVANIANTYYNLLALDQQLLITRQTLEVRVKDMETVKDLQEGAIVTGAALVQSEANRYAAEVTIPDLNQSIYEAENALSILLGHSAGHIKRTALDQQKTSVDLKIGIPSQLLKNRPDVQQAEFAFRSAFENTNLARTYFYPQIMITGQGGLSTLQLKNFFDQSIFYNLIGGITQPIFAQGQNKARLKIAQSKQMQAYYSYQQSLLTAGQEVTNALHAYQISREKQISRAKQLAALVKSVDYTKELLRYSSATNYTDVLTSEQSLLSAQLSSVNDRLQELQSVVNLYKALGGGWQAQ